MTVEQSQLVDEHRPKSEACGVDNALGGNLLVYLEDALEVLVDVLVGPPLRSLWKIRLTSTPQSVCG
jgi:hypothetical protein